MKKTGSLWAIFLLLVWFADGSAEDASLPPDLAALPPGVLKYDQFNPDTSPFGRSLKDSADYWVGVLFTVDSAAGFPDSSSGFSFEGVEFKVNNELLNTTDTAYLYLVNNTNVDGLPRPNFAGGLLESVRVVAPFNRLQGAAFPGRQFVRNDSFWVVLGPVPGGPDDTLPGQGWWAFLDTAQNQQSYVSFGGRDSLVFRTGSGNFVIRARGDFTSPQIVVNEVMFNSDPTSSDLARNHEWVELFNKGQTQSTQGWQLRNGFLGVAGAPSDSFDFPSNLNFPESTYLVIHFYSGADSIDANFNDDRGDIFVHRTTEFFNDRKDACALLIPQASASQKKNFSSIVSWHLGNLGVLTLPEESNPLLNGDLTPTEEEAQRQGFPVEPNREIRRQPGNALGPLFTATAGISIGRDSASSDSRAPGARNVAFLGGKDAAGPTLGGKNRLSMDFSTTTPSLSPVSDTAWTVMLYFAADNGADVYTQERWCYDILNQLEREIPSDRVQVAVLFDVREAGSDMAYRGQLLLDSTDVVRNLEQIPISSMGDPATLDSFLVWARRELPATNYVLALKGDGAGWEGLCGDRGADRLEMGELKSALQHGLGGKTLQLLILDAPLMSQLEVATQVKDFARFMVASPEMTGPADLDYAGLVRKLSNQPGTDSLLLARFVIDSLLERRVGKDPFSIWAAVNLGNLDLLLTKVSQQDEIIRVGITDVCRRGAADDNFQLYFRKKIIFNRVVHYGKQSQGMADFIDLKEFARLVANTPAATTCGVREANYRARAVEIDPLLVNRGSVIAARSSLSSSKNPARVGGLSVYFPFSRERETPVSILFEQKQNVFSNTGDHPFDKPGLGSEAPEISEPVRIYAADTSACYPIGDPQNFPHPPVANFDFVNNYSWDEFLIRYYKPVADIDSDFVERSLGAPVVLNASGSSDPDDARLTYSWDLFDDLNSDSSDADKDCQDEKTDDSDFVILRAVDTLKSGLLPGDNVVWLHVRDERTAQFQTASTSFLVQVDFKDVQFAFEDSAAAVVKPYRDALGAIRPEPTVDPVELFNPVSRTAMPQNKFTSKPEKPHVILSTGRNFDQMFPSAAQAALDSTLAFDGMGVWVSAPLAGKDSVAKAFWGTPNYGFKIPGADSFPAGYLVPDANLQHFLRGLDTLELKSGTRLEKLTGLQPPVFALLVTDSGDTVAAARVRADSQRAIIFSTFGIEHLVDISGDGRRLMEEILRWLTIPTPPPDLIFPIKIGDLSGDGLYTSADVVLLINCVFLGVGCPANAAVADVDCNGTRNSSDVVLLTNRVFLGLTSPPWCGD